MEVFSFSYQFIPLVFSIFLSFGLIVYLFKYRKSPVIKALLLILSGALIWSLAHFLEHGCNNFNSKIFWVNIGYIGITIVPVGWLILSFLYWGKSHTVTRNRILVLLIVPALTIIFNATNRFHGLMRYDVSINYDGPFSIITRTPGVWFWVNVFYCNVLMLAGSTILFKRLFTPPKIQNRQLLLVIFAIIIPWIGTLTFIFNLIPGMRIDPAPSLIPISVSLIALALYPFNVFDVIPIARDFVLEHINDGIVVLDKSGRIIDYNPAAIKIFNIGKIKFGTPFSQTFNMLSLPDEQITKNEVSYKTEIIYQTGDSKKFIEVETSPLFSKNKIIIGKTIRFIDVTKRRKLQETLIKTQRLDSLSTLAGGIAHEFNNIHSAVFGYLDLALNTENIDKIQEFLLKALLARSRAVELTDQLLTFSKGGAPFYKEEPVSPFFQNRLELLLKKTNIKRTFNIDPDITKCWMDKKQMGQVIDEIIMNAKEAMDENGGEISLTIKNVDIYKSEKVKLKEGKYVEIAITDNGNGIPEDILPNIFDPFFTTKEVGTGLGLSAAYSIVDQHGGTIEVETEEGKGTTFHLFLPAAV
jgi:signal transduction histidine kinase